MFKAEPSNLNHENKALSPLITVYWLQACYYVGLFIFFLSQSEFHRSPTLALLGVIREKKNPYLYQPVELEYVMDGPQDFPF